MEVSSTHSPWRRTRRKRGESIVVKHADFRNLSDGMDDDQTQFLNYILTKIANSQPEVQ